METFNIIIDDVLLAACDYFRMEVFHFRRKQVNFQTQFISHHACIQEFILFCIKKATFQWFPWALILHFSCVPPWLKETEVRSETVSYE